MVRVRKLVLAIAAASALTSGMAHALGLGEVTLKSALNQPLVAEIELLEVRDLASNELIPSLAAPEEFNKAGVDRPYFLTDLKFTPVIKPSGKSVIRVTSSKPVREPYLNFLVEVLWPNGRLLREYTLLLDPPLYAPQAAPAPQAPVASSTPRTTTAPAPAPRTTTTQPTTAPRTIDGNEYKTSRSDTLWEIAERVRGGNSVHQAMLAIQDLNPDAFINDNINLMKSGQVLRLPDEQQIKSRSQSEAIAQVAAQNTAWRESRGLAAGARQLDATKRTTAGATPAKSESKDSLRLVSGESGKTTAGSDKGANGDSKALADKLAVTQESLDSTRRENAELTSRVSDLQSQLDKLQRLIQLKDEQLAKLQADLAADANQPKATPEQPAAEKPADVPAKPGEQAATPAAKPAQTPPAEPDFNYEEPVKPDAAAADQPKQPASEPAGAVKPAAKPAEKPAAAKPAQPAPVAEPPQPAGLFDDLLANPMMLGIAGGGVLLLLLVGLMVLSRRNAMKEAELQESLAAEDEHDSFPEMEMPDTTFEGLESTTETAVAPASMEERVSAQTGDALGEADIYIAYGRFSQAAELLQNAINQEPQRSDLRLKLMEVQAELGDREGFARQESELREIGGSNAQVEQLKAKYPAMAAAAAAGIAGAAASDDLDSFSLDDLTLDEPAAEAPAGQELDDSFELSLDDLEADLDRDVRAAASSESSLDLDDLTLDGDLDLPSAGATESSADEDLDFDLELASEPAAEELGLGDDLADFSLDLAAEEAPASAAQADEDEFMLSLDEEPAPASAAGDELAGLSLDLPEEEAPAADLDLPADFDLSLADEELAEPEKSEADSFAAQLDEVSEELDQLSGDLDQPFAEPETVAPAAASAAPISGLDGEDDFDFLSGTDESATKLDLARAYIDMGDTEGARDILDEVITEGNDSQQQEAREMLARLA